MTLFFSVQSKDHSKRLVRDTKQKTVLTEPSCMWAWNDHVVLVCTLNAQKSQTQKSKGYSDSCNWWMSADSITVYILVEHLNETNQIEVHFNQW